MRYFFLYILILLLLACGSDDSNPEIEISNSSSSSNSNSITVTSKPNEENKNNKTSDINKEVDNSKKSENKKQNSIKKPYQKSDSKYSLPELSDFATNKSDRFFVDFKDIIVRLESVADNFLTKIKTKEKLKEAINISTVPNSNGTYPGLMMTIIPIKPRRRAAVR